MSTDEPTPVDGAATDADTEMTPVEVTAEVPAVPESETAAVATSPSLVTRRGGAAGPGHGFGRRFAGVYLALALLTGISIGSLVVLLSQPGVAPEAAWSSWQPTGSETAMGRQIADRVARTYRLENGEQLVVALGGPPTVTVGGDESGSNIPVTIIAVRPDTSAGVEEDDDIDVLPAAGSHQFVLCGLGAACAIEYGTPSSERHALLRREALELALYTFRYVPTVDSVTVFLPPPPPSADGSSPANVVFLRRQDVADELRHPLRLTLDPSAPPIGQMSTRDLASVNRLTLPNLYDFEYTQAQDGSAILILDPIVSST